MLIYPPCLEFVFAFLGTMVCGAVPVPVYPPAPNRLDRDGAALARVVEDCRASIALTNTDYTLARRMAQLTGLVRQTSGRWPRLRWYVTNRVQRGRGVQHRAAPDDVALLQYTSGSTSDPKGVMITHANIEHQLDLNRRELGMGPDARAVMWVPQYHDFGLISGILSAAWGNLALWMMSPFTFLKRPDLWFSTMARVRATHTAAPNFGYALALRKITAADRRGWDLSSVRVMMSAAEPIHAPTMDRFFDAFADTGLSRAAFCPAYGLAEHTVGVTVGGRARARIDRAALTEGRVQLEREGGLAIVGCGRPSDDVRVRIVDPDTSEPLAAGAVGEIWVQSPSVAAGYLARPEQTNATFRARLVGEAGEWLRTGDLGFLLDGEVAVAGRLKDLIIVRGRNVHPEDVESTIRSVSDEIRPGGVAAFGVVDADGGEALAAALELADAVSGANVGALAAAVRDEVIRVHGVALELLYVGRRGLVAKTTSGKIRRQACAAAHEDDRLRARAIRCVRFAAAEPDAPAAAPSSPAPTHDTTSEALDVVVALLADQLGIEQRELDIHRSLTELGLDSVGAVELAGKLAARFERALPDTLAFEHPTAHRLALHLGRPRADRDASEPVRELGDQAIAIVGLACRFPRADDAASLWTLLETGGDAITEVPPERWAVDDWYAPKPTPGRMSTRWGGFVAGIERFDAAFFGISDREAESLDPQGRLLLEVTAEALDHAGLPRDELRGSRLGVFVGLCGHDYMLRALASPSAITGHSLTGTAHSTIAGRIAYWLGTHGPALAVDTACSSSAMAVHLACQSLRAGECETAIAGGANVILAPEGTVYFSQAGAMSPSGRCRSFSADADGYVRSDGCGVVVLKPLADARRDGDRVLAVIAGSAANQDGQSAGLTAPNAEAQVQVLRAAWSSAGIDGTRLAYVECHGTGTPLGDPIEANAIADAVGEREAPLRIGSLKSNIGHTEGAAGVAGLIKVVLSLVHERLPASLHADEANPRIDWTRLELVRDARPWPASDEPRWAGVSSFGFGGTNVHLVVRDEPPTPAAERSSTLDQPLPILVSGASAEAVVEHARRIAADLEAAPERVVDVAYTLALRRTHQRHRAAVVTTTGGWQAALRAVSPCRAHRELRVGFTFPETSAVRPGVGRQLAERWPVFAHALEQAARHCEVWADVGWREVLWGPASERLEQPRVAEAASLCVGWALSRLWASWGIEPVTASGEGVGALVADCVMGRRTLREVAERLGSTAEPRSVALAEAELDVVLTLAPDPDPDLDERAAILGAAARLWALGAPVDLRPLVVHARLADLPAYPWQRRRHWLDARPRSRGSAAPPAKPCGDPLMLSIGDLAVWEQVVDPEHETLWAEHRVGGRPVFPAAAYLRVLLATADDIALRDVRLLAPLALDRSAVVLQVIRRDDALSVSSRAMDAHDWTRHVTAVVTKRAPLDGASTSAIDDAADDAVAVEPGELYRALERVELVYGPRFRRARDLVVRGDRARGRVDFGDDPSGSFDLAGLDACLHVMAAAAGVTDGVWVPVGFDEVQVAAERLRGTMLADAEITRRSADRLDANLTIRDRDGTTVAELRGVVSRRITPKPGVRAPPATGTDAEDVRSRVAEVLRESAAEVLGIDCERVDMSATPMAHGFDSMMAVELADLLRERLAADIEPALAVSADSFEAIVDEIVARLAAQRAGYALPIWERLPKEWEPSFVQQAMAADSRWLPGGFVHSRASAIEGPMRPAVLEDLWQRFTARHTLLRSSLDGAGEGATWRHHPRQAPPFELRDVGDLDDAALERELATMALTPIELSEAPCRATVWRRRDDSHVLQVDFHHVTYDAESMRELLQDLAAVMTGEARPQRPAASRHHGRFAALEREWMTSEAGRDARSFWHRRLAGVPFHVFERSEDLVQRPAAEVCLQRSIQRTVDDAVASAFDRGAARVGGTANAGLVAAWASAVRRALTGPSAPLAIGLSTSLRHSKEMRHLEGPVINCLPIVIPASDASAPAMLPTLMQTLAAARQHERYPFGALLHELGHARGHGWPAWCLDVNIHVYELDETDTAASLSKPGGLRVREVMLSHLPVVRATPLTLYVTRRGRRMILQIRHTRALLSDELADRLLRDTAEAVEVIARGAAS